MALHQEAGYERLYRWGQQQTRSLTQDEVDVGNVLQRAMQASVLNALNSLVQKVIWISKNLKIYNVP